MSSWSALNGSFFVREAEAPHKRLSIMPSAAIVTMGEMRFFSMSRFRLPRSRRSASISVRGMSPTVAMESIRNRAETTVAKMMPTSEPGTRAPHFFGQTIITTTTSKPISTAWRFG